MKHMDTGKEQETLPPLFQPLSKSRPSIMRNAWSVGSVKAGRALNRGPD